MTDKVPHDVAALVVAVRDAWDYLQEHCPNDNVTASLGKALEEFSSRVCWDDEGGSIPEAHADPCTCAMSEIQRLGQEFDAGEPVAWLYERQAADGPEVIVRTLDDRWVMWKEDHDLGWTETPLYAHPPQSRAAEKIDVDAIANKWLADMDTPSLSARHVSLKAAIEEALSPQSRGQAFDGEGEGFAIGDPVEKFTGEAIWHGVIVASYLTSKSKRRYVVEVEPQGFQMIAVPSQLRALSSAKRGEER